MGNNPELLQWIITDKSTNLINQQQKNLLWEEQLKLHQTKNEQQNCKNQLLKKQEKQKVHLLFINNIWGTDLVDMQLLGNSNKGIRFLQCVIGMLSKYTWVVP